MAQTGRNFDLPRCIHRIVGDFLMGSTGVTQLRFERLMPPLRLDFTNLAGVEVRQRCEVGVVSGDRTFPCCGPDRPARAKFTGLRLLVLRLSGGEIKEMFKIAELPLG